MLCKKCGLENKDGAKFCVKCGYKISCDVMDGQNNENNKTVTDDSHNNSWIFDSNYGTYSEQTINSVNKNETGTKRKGRVWLYVCIGVAVIIVLFGIALVIFKRNNASEQFAHSTIEAPKELETEVIKSDTADKIANSNDQAVLSSSIQVGEYISFGKYEQDNNLDNGKESIEWKVLDIEENKALLISRYVLDCGTFHGLDDEPEWSNCGLRNWLNTDFYENAFSADERQRILMSDVDDPALIIGYDTNDKWLVSNSDALFAQIIANGNSGELSEDYIFLFDIDEVLRYFENENDRRGTLSEMAYATYINTILNSESNGLDDAVVRNNYEDIEKQYGTKICYWWLRSSGIYNNTAAIVDYDGDLIPAQDVSAEDGGIRPAMWVELSNESK